MGSTFPKPVDHDPGLGIVAFSLAYPNIVRLIHAPADVERMTLRVKEEVDRAAGNQSQTGATSSHGISEITLSVRCFHLGMDKENATYGKLFCLRIFKEMYKMGYDIVVSSDMAQTIDHATWFFVKHSGERPEPNIVCLAPSKDDMLTLLMANQEIIRVARAAIAASWPKGIQREESVVSCGQNLHEIKFHGDPWKNSESVHCKQTLLDIIGRLGIMKYKLLVGTNIKGATDILFFMHDPNYILWSKTSVCMIGLHDDKLKLINCHEMVDPVKDALTGNSMKIQKEENNSGSWVFKIKGNPWSCAGDKSITSRRAISKVSESMMKHGWYLTNAINVCRGYTDKSALLYTRPIQASSINTKFACIAMESSDKICLLDFPFHVVNTLKLIIKQKYLPGIQNEKQVETNYWELKLNGNPWTQNASYSIHAKSALMYIIKEATSMGWSLVTSADVSAKIIFDDSGPNFPADVHTWYFAQMPLPQATPIPEKKEPSSTKSFESLGKPDGGNDASSRPSAPPSYEDAVKNY